MTADRRPGGIYRVFVALKAASAVINAVESRSVAGFEKNTYRACDSPVSSGHQ
jgi:hypothetical protein